MNRYDTEFQRRKRYYATQYRYAKQARDAAIDSFRERIRWNDVTLHLELKQMKFFIEKYREMLNPSTSRDVIDKVNAVLDGFEFDEKTGY